MKKKSIESLRKAGNKLLMEAREIEDEETNRIQVPFLKSLVGACYVYRDNSYGSNSGNWDVFRKILGYVEVRGLFHFIYEEVTVDCYGKATLVVESHFAYLNKEWHKQNPFSGYVQCPLTEYNSAKENTLEEMRSQKKMRKELNKKD